MWGSQGIKTLRMALFPPSPCSLSPFVSSLWRHSLHALRFFSLGAFVTRPVRTQTEICAKPLRGRAACSPGKGSRPPLALVKQRKEPGLSPPRASAVSPWSPLVGDGCRVRWGRGCALHSARPLTAGAAALGARPWTGKPATSLLSPVSRS